MRLRALEPAESPPPIRDARGRRSDDAVDAGARSRSPPTNKKGAGDRPRPDATPLVVDARHHVTRASHPLASPPPSAPLAVPPLTPTTAPTLSRNAAGDRPAAPEGDEPPKEEAPNSPNDDGAATGTAGEAPDAKKASPTRAAKRKHEQRDDAADAETKLTKDHETEDEESDDEDPTTPRAASKKIKTTDGGARLAKDAAGMHSVEVRVKGNEGRVIGKGGETIRAIETAHGVKIEMKRDRGVAVVAGADADAVARARDAVRDVAEKGETRGSARGAVGGAIPPYGGGGGYGVAAPQRGAYGSYGGSIPAMPVSLMREPDPGEVLPAELQGDDLDAHVEIQVPCPGKEGRVIGRAGATIKELERQSGASMKVVKGSGVCDIKGPKRLVINARRAVLDTLALQVDRFVGSSGPAQGGDWTCPACGASVFGSKDKCFACGTPKPAGGAMAGAMAGGMMGGMAGGMGAMGAMGAAGAAGGASHAAAPHFYGGVPYGAAAPYGGYAPAYGQVTGSIPGGGGQTSLEVPCRGSEGRVIGKGGEMIKYIQNATGAKLDMKRDVGTVLVSGTPDAVAKAQGLVLEVIENGDTRDKGGLVPGAHAAAGVPGDVAGTAPGMMAGGAAPGMMAGGAAPVMVAVPMGAAPGAFYAAPHAAASGYQLQQAYGAPMAAAPYGAPPHAQAQAYDPAAAACAAAAAEWGQAAQAQQQQAMQAQQQQQAPQQTGEWQTHYSEGRAYYYNVATGETRWA